MLVDGSSAGGSGADAGAGGGSAGCGNDDLFLDYGGDETELCAPTAVAAATASSPAVSSSPATASPATSAPSPADVAACVAALSSGLDEPNVAGLALAVAELPGGVAQARDLFETALGVEASGGLLTADGTRRRSPGGVFFALLRDVLPADAFKRVLKPQASAHNAARARRKGAK